jgi:hydroxymethylglutaryl-CoA reductase (NADPH)
MAEIPMRDVGPIRITGPLLQEDVRVPMATFESPLWPSTARGGRVSVACGGIGVTIARDLMSRSILLEAPSAVDAVDAIHALEAQREEIREVVNGTTRFGSLTGLNWQIAGKLIFLRIEMQTGDASGHNMVTQAADAAMNWILQNHPTLRYVSISGNYCTDKKASAVNGILGRGKYVVAEMVVPTDICKKLLRTTPEAIMELNTKKNLIGTSLAGGIRSANAHVANMLLAVYLATGQDAANIIEGSQAYTLCDIEGDALHISVTLPSIIVGTVGNGKGLPFVQENLKKLGCLEPRRPGDNARRLAAIVGATALCGELSLLAAQTVPGELMQAHRRLERMNHE